MTVLAFRFRDYTVRVSMEQETFGHVIESGGNKFPLPHPTWRVLGFSTHHWHTHITIPLSSVKDTNDIKGGIVWDVDHGTRRVWGGQYCGKLPRVQLAWFEQ